MEEKTLFLTNGMKLGTRLIGYEFYDTQTKGFEGMSESQIKRAIARCIYRPDRAHCTALQCMASADTVHAFRSSVHDAYSGIDIPASVN